MRPSIIDDIRAVGGDPEADNKVFGIPVRELCREDLLGVIDLLVKEQEKVAARRRKFSDFLTSVPKARDLPGQRRLF